MPAEVESLMYVCNEANGHFVPWHQLGNPVENAPTSKDAIWMAGLDWTVESKPIYDEFGNAIEGFKRNVRATDNSVFGIVTDKYKIVQNSDAFDFTDSLLDEGITYETAGSLRGGEIIFLLAKMPESKILGDDFENYICFTNAHNGKGAIQVCMTNTRVVCMNTLNMALSNAKNRWSTKHMGDMKSKLSEARHTLRLANDYTVALGEEAERLAELKVSDAELEALFDLMFPIDYANDKVRKINNINELKANLFTCYNAPDIQQFKGTAWGWINGVADYVDHYKPIRLSSNYQENNFIKILNGNTLLDTMYTSIKKFKKVG